MRLRRQKDREREREGERERERERETDRQTDRQTESWLVSKRDREEGAEEVTARTRI